MSGNCRLCRRSPKRLCRSHIIPEFFYRPARDKRGRGVAKELTRSTGTWREIRKGYRERLLCEGCERFLNIEYEKYVKHVWFDERILPDPFDEEVCVVQGIDYAKFKLCHLSILWRASVSNSDFFRQVSLGPHEETIRRMLLDRDPGSPRKYAFATQALVMYRRVVFAALMEPVEHRFGGHRAYTFIYGGCSWNFFVGAETPQTFASLSISDDGQLPVMRQEFTQLDLVRDFMVDYLRES